METDAKKNGALHVLCLEDTPQDVEIMRELLTNAGFVLEMDCTDKEKEYVSFLRTRTYDIILSDFKLPGFDGFAALHWAMEICPRVPFICVSGTIGEEKAIELLKQGAVDYIIKDKMARLPASIHRALDEAKEKELRRQAEEKLWSQQLMLSRTEDIAHIGSWAWDIATDTVTWSDELFRIFQRDPREGAPSFAEHPTFYHPDDMARLQQAVEAAVADGIPYELELRAIRKDGETRVCVARGMAEMKLGGRVVRLFGSFQDITERKRTENVLSDLIENNPMSIQIVDKNGFTLKTNPTHTLFFGSVPPPDFSIFDDLQKKGFGEYILLAKKGEVVHFPDVSYNVHDVYPELPDKPVWIRAVLFPLINSGILEKFVFMHEDITERKQAEEALMESEENFRSLFENSLMGISLAAPEGRLIKANKAYARMYGYENPNEMMAEVANVGKLYVNPGDRKEVQRILAEKGVMEPREVEVVYRDGTHFFVLVSARAIRDASGKILYSQADHIDITERKRSEGALQESETRYRSVLQSATDAIVTVDRGGMVVGWNSAAERIFGYSYTEAVGQLLTFIISLYPFDEHTNGMKGIQSEGGQSIIGKTVEFKGFRKDKSVFPIELSLSSWETNSGQFFTGIIRDITERKQVEEALAKERFQMNMLMDNIPDQIYFKDKESRFLRMNKAQVERFGLEDPVEALGKTDFEYFTEQHARPAFEYEQKIMKTGQPIIGLEEEETWPDGRKTWVITTKMPLRDKEGEIIGTFGISRDITERKRAEEALQESEERFRSLYENATIGLYRTTPDGDIVLANPALIKMLGYTSFQDLVKRNLKQDGFEPTYERKDFLEKIERDGTVKSFEAKWIRQDGTAIFVLESARAIRDSHGKTLYYDGTVEDITEHKHMEEGLRQMQKLEGLGTLAGGIAHDFNNILGIILAHNTNILRCKNEPKKLELAAETITKAVDRGKTLVMQILMFARKTETAFGAVDVNDVVMEIMIMIFETFPKNITYAQNFGKTVPYINADRSQVYQVLLNLCVNARDAMPKGGILSVNTSMASVVSLRQQHPEADASGYVCIEVSDTGEGMTPETQKRIFEPFFTTKSIGKGTGLGLSVTFGVIQAHKGFIDVESKLGNLPAGKAGGTTFRIYLPASQTAVPMSEKKVQTLEEIPGGTETLLIVEDEEMLIVPLQMALADKGYKVLTAGDGLAALKIYQEGKNNINLVLTDFGLPGMTGLEVSQQIKKINPQEHIILATGFLDPQMKAEFLKAGIKHFLYKPYDLRQVLKVLREVLDEK